MHQVQRVLQALQVTTAQLDIPKPARYLRRVGPGPLGGEGAGQVP